MPLLSSLVGSWNAVFGFRRPLMCCFDSVYEMTRRDPEWETPWALLAVDDLLLAVALLHLAETDVTTPFAPWISALDASPSHGAVVDLDLPTGVARLLWNLPKKKGGYSRLDNKHRAALRATGRLFRDWEADRCDESLPRPQASREPALVYDFVEFCGGAGGITAGIAAKGGLCAPPIDISVSRHFDMRGARLLEWAIWMLWEGRILCFTVEPPCTTFSSAAFPSVRSYAQPRGYNQRNPKILHGNILAFRSLLLLLVGLLAETPGLGEQPRLSKMAWLTEWKRLLLLGLCSGNAGETWTASCAFHDFALDGYVVFRK